MFSLIITIISIALVGALAVASIYYGGDAFSQGTGKASVTALVNQYQQIKGAADLYHIENMSAPTDISDLTTEYLETQPDPSEYASGDWEISSGDISLSGIETDLCTYINDGDPDDSDSEAPYPSFECNSTDSKFQLKGSGT
ncbi:hypothetical protein [Vreelandella massiliensis]|uniref:hypothetical protein n=1 Tax=Vreelandella massiliensis TaxID=1816686 RepID=UPI00096A6BDC|nr:hypothetical protein [Halomonas massiliensis]